MIRGRSVVKKDDNMASLKSADRISRRSGWSEVTCRRWNVGSQLNHGQSPDFASIWITEREIYLNASPCTAL